MVFYLSKRKNLDKWQPHIDQIVKALEKGKVDFRFKETKKELPFPLVILNSLLEKLEPRLSNWLKERRAMENVLNHLEEAIAFVDRNGLIIKANIRFNQLFDFEAVEGKFIWQIIRSSDFQEVYSSFQRDGKKREVELYLQGRPYLVKVFPINDEVKSEVEAKEAKQIFALILRDISAEKNLEIIKRELVANISHELRTPLTMIKGYVETLEEEDMGIKARYYVGIIKDNLERLERIICDLLTLSELENRAAVMEREKIDLREIINRVVAQFENMAKERNLYLRIEIPSSIPPIEGDAFRLEQMLINLVDNALKYTDKGGVTIKLEDKEKEVLMIVEDTGIGIPSEHIDRIFERFYVVDRSRSRKFGGTGLGLSIVKHIVLLHGGRIEVKSQEGRGTSFFIFLPKS